METLDLLIPMEARSHRTLQGPILKIFCEQHKYDVGVVEGGSLVPILVEPVVEVGQESFVMVLLVGTLGPKDLVLLPIRGPMADDVLQDSIAMQVKRP